MVVPPSDPVDIVRAGPERIDELRPLWQALVDHHHATGPQLGPVRRPEETWRHRREYYERELGRPGSLLLIAERDRRSVGYLLATPADPSHTWDGIDPAADVATLSVLPDERGRGIGRAMFEHARRDLRAAGFRQLRLEVLVSNAEAIAFYEREGFHPRFLAMAAAL